MPDTSNSDESIGQELLSFLNDIDCLTRATPVTMLMSAAVVEVLRRNFSTFLDENGREYVEDGKTYYEVPPKMQEEARSKKKSIADMSHVIKIMPTSHIVSLISRYDAYVGVLLRFLIDRKPHLVSDMAKPFTYLDMLQFSSIEAVREFLIEKEIESVLRSSHAAHFKWFEEAAKVKLNVDLPIWPTFIELTERRNLFVHTDGVVSGQYLKVCREAGCKIDEKSTVVGSRLDAGSKYCTEARDCLFEIAAKLTHVIWRKDNPGCWQAADENLNGIAFDLLRDGRYALAQNLLDFAAKYCKPADEEHRRTLVINRAQAYKWQGNMESARKVLAAEDWTATGNHFKLVAAVLEDRTEDACKLVVKMGDCEELPKDSYRLWPVFRDFVKTHQFLETYEAVFGEPFSGVVEEDKGVSTIVGEVSEIKSAAEGDSMEGATQNGTQLSELGDCGNAGDTPPAQATES